MNVVPHLEGSLGERSFRPTFARLFSNAQPVWFLIQSAISSIVGFLFSTQRAKPTNSFWLDLKAFLFSSKNSIIAATAVRLFPSTKGWLSSSEWTKTDAFKNIFGCRSFPPKEALGLPAADSSKPTSRIPWEPPVASTISKWIWIIFWLERYLTCERVPLAPGDNF